MLPVSDRQYQNTELGIDVFKTIGARAFEEDRYVVGTSAIAHPELIQTQLRELYTRLGATTIPVTVDETEGFEVINETLASPSHSRIGKTKVIEKAVNEVVNAGSCGITAVITEQDIHIANLGDSAAYLVTQNAAGTRQVQRINTLHEAGPESLIAVSHAFGDKGSVSHQNDIVSVAIPTGTVSAKLLISCDGLVEPVKHSSDLGSDTNYVLTHLAPLLNQEKPAEAIAKQAIADKSGDNITVAVIDLTIKTPGKVRVISIFDGHGNHEVADGLMKNFALYFEAAFYCPFNLLDASDLPACQTYQNSGRLACQNYQKHSAYSLATNLGLGAGLSALSIGLFYKFFNNRLDPWISLNYMETLVGSILLAGATVSAVYQRRRLPLHFPRYYTQYFRSFAASISMAAAVTVVNLTYALIHKLEDNQIHTVFTAMGIFSAMMLSVATFLNIYSGLRAGLCLRPKARSAQVMATRIIDGNTYQALSAAEETAAHTGAALRNSPAV